MEASRRHPNQMPEPPQLDIQCTSVSCIVFWAAAKSMSLGVLTLGWLSWFKGYCNSVHIPYVHTPPLKSHRITHLLSWTLITHFNPIKHFSADGPATKHHFPQHPRLPHSIPVCITNRQYKYFQPYPLMSTVWCLHPMNTEPVTTTNERHNSNNSLTTVHMALLNVWSLLNTSFIINQLVLDNNIHCLFLTETWLGTDAPVILTKIEMSYHCCSFN